MGILETENVLRHYSFINQSSKISGVRKNFQKEYTLAQIEVLDDPYLSRIDVNHFLSTESMFTDIRYKELVWIIDNYDQLVTASRNDSHFALKYPEKVGKKLAFVLWFQGEYEAPKIVQTNMKRMRKYLSQYELIVLSDDNISDWININLIPNYSYMKEKYPAQLSDLIRLNLLAIYGGIWLDSTVAINSDSEEFLENALASKSQFILRYGPYRVANWLIATKPKDTSMRLQYVSLIQWLKENKAFIEYFQFHTFFEIFAMLDDEFIDAARIKASDAFLLSKDWDKITSVTKIKNTFDIVPFQKLNYKINPNKVTPRTTEFLFENYLDPTSDESLHKIFSLPDGRSNLDGVFYDHEVKKIRAKVILDISSDVDFTTDRKVGELKQNEVVDVEYVSGTIAGTPRLKIRNGYITANKKFVEEVKESKQFSIFKKLRK